MNNPRRLFASFIACWTLLGVRAPAQQSAKPEGGVLTLKEAIHLTLVRAPEIALAESQIAKSGEALREIRSANRPQVVAGTGLAYNNGFPLSIEGSAPSAFQIGVTQPIFNKRNNNLILEAQEGIEASKVGSRSARNDLAARAAFVYYELHQARGLETLLNGRRESARKDLRLTESLLEAGKVRPMDVTLARTAAAAAEQQLLIAREQSHLAESELRELTGLHDGTAIRTIEPQLDDAPFSSPSEVLFQKALENYPEIRQAESNVRAREFHLEAEKAGRYPKLELVSEYALFTRFNNYQDYFNRFSRNNYLVGLSIRMPLFDGFQTSARIAQGRREVTEAQLRFERAKTDLKMSIERGVSAVRVAKGAAVLAVQELRAAQEGLQLSRTLLEGGRISPKDLSGPENLVHEREVAVSESEKSLFQRRIELLRVLGDAAAAY